MTTLLDSVWQPPDFVQVWVVRGGWTSGFWFPACWPFTAAQMQAANTTQIESFIVQVELENCSVPYTTASYSYTVSYIAISRKWHDTGESVQCTCSVGYVWYSGHPNGIAVSNESTGICNHWSCVAGHMCMPWSLHACMNTLTHCCPWLQTTGVVTIGYARACIATVCRQC